ncbi:hypothetical protein KA005_55950, partial [bacterium]|nr:hypothetical protein [bacterium]
DNPRQIKQFINILISHFLMAQNREAGANPLIRPAGTITDNVPFLAKFLLVRQKFPDMYRTITERYLAPEEWGEHGDTDFKTFHRATNMFTVPDVRPFIYLKQSPEELQIPGLRKIEQGLLENNEEVVLKRLKSLSLETDRLRHFNAFLLNLVRRYQNTKPSLINILGCSLAVSKNLRLELREQFYGHLAHLLNDPDGLKDDLHHFSSLLVFGELLPQCKDKHRAGIIGEYVKYICLPRHEKNAVKISPDQKGKSSIGRNFAYDLLEEFVKNKHWLNNDEKEKIKGAIENAYYNDIEVLSLFEVDVENQKVFISEEAISKFVSNFSEKDVQDIYSINGK